MAKPRPLVMIVDDDEAVRDALQFTLEIEGLEVHVHRSGDDLLTDAKLPQAGCLVLDSLMPRMSGLEVLHQMQERDIHVPTILLTCNATADFHSRAAAAGVRVILEKPFLSNALSRNVLEILDGHSQRPSVQLRRD